MRKEPIRKHRHLQPPEKRSRHGSLCNGPIRSMCGRRNNFAANASGIPFPTKRRGIIAKECQVNFKRAYHRKNVTQSAHCGNGTA